MRSLAIPLLVWPLVAVAASGQPSGPMPVQQALPPLMYVRIVGPTGMQVTFFRGDAGERKLAVPVTAGLRPGYIYRLAISDIPDRPNVVLYPSLLVQGSLFLQGGNRNADFPAVLNFTNEDFSAAAAGVMTTKVIVLEDPERAMPLASRADRPLQIDVPPRRNPVEEAWLHGKPLVILKMGQRLFSREELASAGIAGTVFLPGDSTLAGPALPAHVPWRCWPLLDPRMGPHNPGAFQALHDGGDVGLPAGIGPDGKLRGLDPSDTVAEYTDSQGQRRLAVSNRIGLCIPRFLIVKSEAALAEQTVLVSTGSAHVTHGRSLMRAETPPLAKVQNQHLAGTEGRQRLSANEFTSGTAVIGKIDGLTIMASIQDTGTMTGSIAPHRMSPVDGPLVIIKFPDRCGGAIGDEINFTLRFRNTGGRPITGVVVSDSLTTRFRYVLGSARTDREAVFTTRPNDAGSSLLRWQFPGVLQPGEMGTITFKVTVQ
jgi:uncharacterized repeat protein (TIGR01451 family)